jgi:hypothetical protein
MFYPRERYYLVYRRGTGFFSRNRVGSSKTDKMTDISPKFQGFWYQSQSTMFCDSAADWVRMLLSSR